MRPPPRGRLRRTAKPTRYPPSSLSKKGQTRGGQSHTFVRCKWVWPFFHRLLPVSVQRLLSFYSAVRKTSEYIFRTGRLWLGSRPAALPFQGICWQSAGPWITKDEPTTRV